VVPISNFRLDVETTEFDVFLCLDNVKICTYINNRKVSMIHISCTQSLT
jgi:hypothetical protein